MWSAMLAEIPEPTKPHSRHPPPNERAAAMPQSHRPIRLNNGISTMASNTCRYCCQLVVPANLGTLVDVNVTCLGVGKVSRTPGVRRYRDATLMSFKSAADGILYPPIRSHGTREDRDGLN